MATGEQFIESGDGIQLFVKQYDTASPKAQILILHGYLEHCGRYKEFAEYLNTQHIAVTTFDFRGHGKSGGDRPVIRQYSEYSMDVNAVKERLLPNVPAFLFGHSNGGLCTLNYMLSQASDDDKLKPFVGVIVTNPYLEPFSPLSWISTLAVKAIAPWFPKLKIPANLSGDKLTNDLEKRKEHDEDPLNQPDASMGWVYQALLTQKNLKVLGKTTKFPRPLLFLYSDHDQVGSPKAMAEFSTALSADDKTIVLRKDEQHEILNEPKRQESFAIISEWVLKHL